jgi:hypothetical protein
MRAAPDLSRTRSGQDGDPEATLLGGYYFSAANLRALSCRLTLIAEAGEHARFGSSVSAAELRRVSVAGVWESKLTGRWPLPTPYPTVSVMRETSSSAFVVAD